MNNNGDDDEEEEENEDDYRTEETQGNEDKLAYHANQTTVMSLKSSLPSLSNSSVQRLDDSPNINYGDE